MDMRGNTRIAVVVLLILPALARGDVARTAEGARPFALVLSGNANPVPTEDPCVLVNTETGTGLVSPIGVVAWESREAVNFCSNPEGADIEGEFVITAWNRDQIRGRYRTLGQADAEADELTAIGRYAITGGTGRFKAVAGKGVVAAAGRLSPPFAFKGGLFGSLTF